MSDFILLSQPMYCSVDTLVRSVRIIIFISIGECLVTKKRLMIGVLFSHGRSEIMLFILQLSEFIIQIGCIIRWFHII